MVALFLGLPDIDVNSKDVKSRTALWIAASMGHARVVELLLRRDTVKADVRDTEGSTPLFIAAARGHNEVVRQLLEAGKVGVNKKSSSGWTPLQKACWGGHRRVVKLLLDKGADILLEDRIYGNALKALQGASDMGFTLIVEMLLDKGADVNTKSGVYGNALYGASARGSNSSVELLLERGAKVDAIGGLFGTALQIASLSGWEPIIKLLLDKGAKIEAQGGRYSNAIEAALEMGENGKDQPVKIVRLLVDHTCTEASSYIERGCWKEVDQLWTQLTDACRPQLGQPPRSTITRVTTLAALCRRIGNENAALSLIEGCFKLQEKVLGLDHPETISSFQLWYQWQTEDKSKRERKIFKERIHHNFGVI